MEVLLLIAYILAGIVMLYLGAEGLVKGASDLAYGLGISPLVVGLTVVSFATSSPEAVASLTAQLLEGSGAIALGNVVGSNIANMGLILGSTCLVAPVTVCGKTAWREMPIMLGATVLLGLIFYGGMVSRPIAVGLLALLAGYVAFHIQQSRREAAQSEQRPARQEGSALSDIGYIAGGTLVLVLGGYALVEGSAGLMALLGVPERVTGLSIVALGTSCPELAASLVAARKGHSDLAIGNVVGSNIFNILFIVGLAGLVQPIPLEPGFMTTDLPVLLGFSFGLWALIAWAGALGAVRALFCCFRMLRIWPISSVERVGKGTKRTGTRTETTEGTERTNDRKDKDSITTGRKARSSGGTVRGLGGNKGLRGVPVLFVVGPFGPFGRFGPCPSPFGPCSTVSAKSSPSLYPTGAAPSAPRPDAAHGAL